MTNQERDMGDIRKREREIRKPSKAKERLTVVIFKGVGKVRTFKISPHFLLWVSLFFIFYFVVTIFLTNLFIDYYRNNKMLADENAELRAMLNKGQKRSLEESKQHIALLDDYITEKKESKPKTSIKSRSC